MIKIAIIGGPQSGKTDLAEALKERWSGNDDRSPVHVIDGYVNAVEERMDIVTGVRGNYMANIAVALERIAWERTAEQDDKINTFITVGSLLETSVYTAMNFERSNEIIFDDAEKQDEAKRVEATMKTLACFYMDSYLYDHVFYCPPIQSNDETQQFDRNLQAAFQAFYLNPVTPLMVDGGDMADLTENRVELVLEEMAKEAVDESDAEGAGASAQASN